MASKENEEAVNKIPWAQAYKERIVRDPIVYDGEPYLQWGRDNGVLPSLPEDATDQQLKRWAEEPLGALLNSWRLAAIIGWAVAGAETLIMVLSHAH